MAGFTKNGVNSVLGTSAGDVILVTLGEHALTGTIAGAAGIDELRFGSLTPGDILFIGANVTGIERVTIGGGTAVSATLSGAINNNPLDIDASASLNGLTIAGNAGSNLIVGSEFDDRIVLSGGVDDLLGGGGNDVFSMTRLAAYDSATAIDGGDGFDVLELGGPAGAAILGMDTQVERVAIIGQAAISVDASAVFAGAGLELAGNSAVNQITGTAFGDTFTGGGGADRLFGGGGDDLFLFAAATEFASGEVVDGGAGTDTVRYVSTTPFSILVLGTGVAGVERIELAGTTALGADARSAASFGVHLVGNSADNFLVGSSGSDTFTGGGGNDVFLSVGAFFGAVEHIDGGAGSADIVWFNPSGSVIQTLTLGADTTGLEFARIGVPNVFGVGTTLLNVVLPWSSVSGSTTGSVRASIDASQLSAANPIHLQGNAGANSLIGGAGDDTLVGGAGNDTLAGGAGNDVLRYQGTAEFAGDAVAGGSGWDRLELLSAATQNTYVLPASMSGIEEVRLGNLGGTPVPFLIDASAMSTALVVTTTIGNLPAASIIGTAFGDTLGGGVGNDSIAGGAGDDSITGGAGNDTLDGGAGADTLDGGQGSDVYRSVGVLGADVVSDSGASGIDVLEYNFMSDFFFAVPAGSYAGIEKVRVTATGQQFSGFGGGTIFADAAFDASALAAGMAFETAILLGSIELGGTDFDDTFTVAGPSSDDHSLNGGLGDDSFRNVLSSYVDGGAGTDTVVLVTHNPADRSFSWSTRWSGIEAIEMPDGTGPGGVNQPMSFSGALAPNALAIEGNSAANVVIATNFDDVLSGNAGNDALSGGTGNDTLAGGPGADQMLGGPGDDVFLDFAAGDRVSGGTGGDTLMLTGAGQALDLTVISNAALRGVETIDISGSGANSLKLNFDDVKYNLGVNATLRIVTDADDEVTLAGAWTNLGTDGGVTTYIATSRGQSVFVEVEAPPSGALTYDAIDGTDSFVGGSGNDTINFGPGDFDPSADFIDGGGGFDTLVVDGLTLDMGEAFFSNLERVELHNGAVLIADNGAFEVVAIAGSNEAQLGSNAAQSYTGNASGDDVVLGAAGQEVHTGAGNDEVQVGADELAGSILELGDENDQLIFDGSGAANMLDAASISPGLLISYGNGITSLTLDNGGHRVAMNANMDATLTSGDNSGGDDTFAFGSNDWTGRSITIHEFLQGAGNDRIEINIVSFSGEYYGETDSAGVDALLPDDGLRNGVLDTELGALIVDYDRSGTYSAFGDLTVFLAGVSDLTAGSDITFF